MLKNLINRNFKLINYRKKCTTPNVLKLKERGMYQDLFPDNSANKVVNLLNGSPQCVYSGFDPTADSLHVGNLLVLINLLHWQRGGHQTIAVIGGATAKIGDPSGRTTERDPLSLKSIDDNIQGVYENITEIFENHQKYLWDSTNQLKPVLILNNNDWYEKLSAIDLIAGAGRYLRMGDLISRSSVQTRLQSAAGMSLTEFSYQLFQSYDWLHLFKTYNCNFQIGGSDQMGNIMSGHELISKTIKKPVYGLTIPLITTEMGDKFGKSAGNAIWLTAKHTSPFTLYQFWMRQQDSEIEKMLKLFTFLTLGEIEDLLKQHKEKPELRKPHRLLAEQVTLLVHGKDGLESAQNTSKMLYESSTQTLGTLKVEEIKDVFEGSTIVELLSEPGLNVLDLAMKARCFSTKEDAIRIITAGGFSINQKKVKNPNEILCVNVHRLANNVSLLRVGKRNYYIIKWLS